MAGIGFELRRLLVDEPGLLSKIRGYVCAGLVSSGPWLMTMLSLWVMSLFRSRLTNIADFDDFRALVTYAFAFSLITVGTLQMAVTRRLADVLYRREYERVLPAFAATLGAVGLVQTTVALLFGWLAGFEAATIVLFAALYVVISLTWVALIWLSCIRQYDQIFAAYLLGMGVSFATMKLLDTRAGIASALAAYTAGQALTLAWLLRLIVRGTEAAGKRDFSIFQGLKTYPDLVLIGLFYSTAIWIDKIVFWFVDGVGTHPAIRFHPLYDTCCFLAYITVLPSLALNLVHIETSFYERYRSYYAAILAGMPLHELEQRRQEMTTSLREGAVRLVRIQGAVSLVCIVLAPQIVDVLALPEAAIRTFQLACLGAMFHVLLLITTLVLLYFDLRRTALTSCLLFLVLNGTFALSSLRLGVHTYGLGYALASLIALTTALVSLCRGVRNLDYFTFTNQPRLLEK